jgi:hypothetical protein
MSYYDFKRLGRATSDGSAIEAYVALAGVKAIVSTLSIANYGDDPTKVWIYLANAGEHQEDANIVFHQFDFAAHTSLEVLRGMAIAPEQTIYVESSAGKTNFHIFGEEQPSI